LQVFLGRARSNPRWLMMDALSRFAFVRRAVRALRPYVRLPAYDCCVSQFANVDVDGFVENLNRDGYCGGLQIPAANLNEILRRSAAALCYGDADTRYGFRYADKAAAQAAAQRVFSQAT